MLPFKQNRTIENILDGDFAPVTNLEFRDGEFFLVWLAAQHEIVKWNSGKKRMASRSDEKLPEGTAVKKSKAGRPVTLEWSKVFTCSFSGTPRSNSDDTKKRIVSKPSRKIGCKASIKIQKKVGDERIFVVYNNSHTGHSLNSFQSWTQSRLSPKTSEWLKQVVATGINWEMFKKMSRAEGENIDFLRIASLGLGQSIEIPEMLRISNKDFYNYQPKFLREAAHLHSECEESLRLYAKMIENASGLATLQDVQEDQIGDEKIYFFLFVPVGNLNCCKNTIQLYF